jgi:outer membrane lipoprotein-sorting protein
MAEFKFSCPRCGQHIQCNPGYSGAQINCPSCQQAIVVPQAPHSAAAPSAPAAPLVPPVPPPTAPGLSTKQSTTAPASGRRFAGAPGLTSAPPPKPKSKALKTVLIVAAAVVVLAGLGAGGWFGFSKIKEHKAAKANPAAQVAAPSSTATIQALSILGKVHSAYTNLSSVKAEGTLTLFLDLSNLTMADLNPDAPVNAKNPKTSNRRPPGMPRIIANTTDYSVKRAQTNWFYFAGEAVSKIDRMSLTNTIAMWSADRGTFMFMNSHQRGAPATYQQLAEAGSVNNPSAQMTEQARNMQHLFDDPANLAKIIKDLGQTGDEPVNGQDCYTLTAKVLGQKVKIWVDKSTYLISQSEITLGGTISDADVDDAFSLVAAGFTNLPPAQLDMAKAQVKKYTPAMTKIRGTITSTTKDIEINPTLSADDFVYPVPPGVRLIRLPAGAAGQAAVGGNAAAARANSQRNACINNLRQIDGAKQEWALEKGKANGTPVTEDDIKPYLKLDASGNIPKCPAGGKYTIGKVGELPTCSIPGHALP